MSAARTEPAGAIDCAARHCSCVHAQDDTRCGGLLKCLQTRLTQDSLIEHKHFRRVRRTKKNCECKELTEHHVCTMVTASGKLSAALVFTSFAFCAKAIDIQSTNDAASSGWWIVEHPAKFSNLEMCQYKGKKPWLCDPTGILSPLQGKGSMCRMPFQGDKF